MKRIINGKRYDTETAKKVAHWWNGYGSSDFKACSEDLYRTKKGVYFLHGDGGPMSKYAEPCQGGMSGGERIIPLTEEEAREWLEERELPKELETLFPDSIEDA